MNGDGTTSAFSMSERYDYREGPPRQVPGYSSLHRMVTMLLAERVPREGRILVLGAGGGLELLAMAEAQPGWQFVGVDPDASMLALAGDTTRAYADRISLHTGVIDDAPAGLFDGAVSLLTFHFIAREKRRQTLQGLHARLVHGAPLVLAHISFPQAEPERSRWLSRHVVFGGTAPENEERAKHAMRTRLTILDPAEEEAHLRAAGFDGVSLFYAGLSFRGWVAYAS